MLPRFLRNLAVAFALAGTLLGAFGASDHRLPVLPADASPLGVLLGAFLCALGVSLVEETLRHRARTRG